MALAISRDAECTECKEQLTAHLVGENIPYDRAVSITNRFVGNGQTIRSFNLGTFLTFCPPVEARLLYDALVKMVSPGYG